MFSGNLLIILLVLVAFCALTVYRIVMDIRKKSKCPADRDLKNAVLGFAARRGADHENIISHLGMCEKCRKKVSDLNQADSSK